MRAPTGSFSLLVVLAIANGACGSPSRVRLTVCGDLGVPEEIDSLLLTASGRSGADQKLLSVGALPAWWMIEAGDEVDGSVVLTLDGLRGGDRRLRYAAFVDFMDGRTVEVGVFLARQCLDVGCAISTSCGPAGTCVSPPIAADRCCSPAPCDPGPPGSCGPDGQCTEQGPLEHRCCY
jgi:hypothetical protein